jgi:hypothetical protein
MPCEFPLGGAGKVLVGLTAGDGEEDGGLELEGTLFMSMTDELTALAASTGVST